ncbi:MAG: polymer-forming cytoskeletal protein [Candidatus Delongbacteria bacterium]|nr:polymer-forming cytoskeletal protein [Candidatus Delongbacteria bacterium]
MRTIIIAVIVLLGTISAETVTKFTDYTLAANDTLRSDVKVYNGNADINGYLEGNLEVYSGDIKIAEAGKVTGEVKAFAGKVFRAGEMDDNASYFVVDELKSLILGKDADSDSDDGSKIEINISSEDEKGFFYHNSLIKKDFFSYSKVEGLYLGLNSNFDLVNTKYVDFDVYASGGYAFRMEEWEYYADQKLSFFDEKFILGGCEYRGAASEDQRKISPLMNSVSALLLHQDFYDYYMTEGYGLFAGSVNKFKTGGIEHEFAVKTGVYSENIDSLKNKTQWALFFNDRDFIPNFDADDGKMVELVTSARYIGKFTGLNTFIDTYGIYEKTLDQYEQDFSFNKGLFSVFIESKVKDMFVFSNLMRLESCSPESPNFKEISMGGMGTLPGYKLNEFRGNRGFYNRFVIGFTGIDLTEIRAILDMGEAYNIDSDDLTEGIGKFGFKTIKSSFGLGLSLGENYMISIHKRLDSNVNPYQFQLSYIYNY